MVGTSAIAQMLATVWDASNIRDIKKHHGGMSAVACRQATGASTLVLASTSMAASTAVTLAIAGRLEWMQALKRTPVTI